MAPGTAYLRFLWASFRRGFISVPSSRRPSTPPRHRPLIIAPPVLLIDARDAMAETYSLGGGDLAVSGCHATDYHRAEKTSTQIVDA